MGDRTVRRARTEDHEAIAAFTEDTWEDWDAGDYIPEAFPEWVATDGPDQYTAVTVVDDDPVGLAQSRLLTGGEAWFQGLRVHSDHRGRGHALAMTRRLQEWSRERDGERVVDYAVAAWADADAARVLFDAIREDATARGGDGTRVLIPESPQYVSDAALAGVPLSDEPVYVFTADLTGLPADR